MRVAGFGFQTNATAASLTEALAAAGGGRLTAIATAAPKAQATCITHLAQTLGLPVRAVAMDDLLAQTTITLSDASQAAYGTGSVAEAAALATAGPGATLAGPREVSTDKLATCAIAIGEPP